MEVKYIYKSNSKFSKSNYIDKRIATFDKVLTKWNGTADRKALVMQNHIQKKKKN